MTFTHFSERIYARRYHFRMDVSASAERIQATNGLIQNGIK